MNSPQINSQYLMFGIKGLFFPDGKGEVAPSVTPPVMPSHNPSHPAKVQAFVSNYLADSLGYTFVRTIGINFWLDHKLIPASSPFKLNTSSMDVLFPGIAAKYGNN